MTTLVHQKQSHGFSLQHTLAVMTGLIQKWIDVSRQRKQLALLDEHMLKDIGVDKAYVRREINKPFWK